MSAELHVKDSATWRRISAVHVNDAGTWRAIKEVHVKDSSTWRQVFASADTFSLVAGDAAAFGNFNGYRNQSSGTNYGSLTPTTTSDGNTVRQIDIGDGSTQLRLLISFAADPGATYYDRIEIDGTAYLMSAATYSYGTPSGEAVWQWAPQTSTIFIPGNTYDVKLYKT